MLAVIVNTVAVLAGGGIGTLLNRWINPRITGDILRVMGLITIGLGLMYVLRSENLLIVIVCCVIGTAVGSALRLGERVDRLNEKAGAGGGFLGSFIAASLLFEVGSMTVVGSVEAVVNHDYTTIFTKSVMDFITSITLAVSMGPGVILSGAAVFVYQGLLTLLFIFVSDALNPAAITEMSAVGGVILLSIGINITDISKKKFESINILPGLILPILWFWLKGLLGIG